MNQSLSAEAPAARHACDTAIEGKSMTDGLIIHFREKIRMCWCRGQRQDGIVARMEGDAHTPLPLRQWSVRAVLLS